MPKVEHNVGLFLKELFNIARPYKGKITLVCSLSALFAVLNLYETWNFRTLIDTAAARARTQLIYAGMIISIVAGLRIITGFLYKYLKERAYYKMVATMQYDYFALLLSKDYGEVTQKHTEEWMSRLRSDTDNISVSLILKLPEAIGTMVHLLGTVYLISWTEWILLPFVLAGCVTIIVINLFVRNSMKQCSRNLKDGYAIKNAYISEHIAKMIIVKAFCKETVILKKANEKLGALEQAKIQKYHISFIKNSVQKAAEILAILAFILYSATQILQGNMSLGTCIMLLRLLSQIRGPLGAVSAQFSSIYDLSVSMERLRELKNYSDDSGKPAKTEKETGEYYHQDFFGIKVSNLYFHYPKRNCAEKTNDQLTVLSDVNLFIPKQTITAITGVTGSGKSTLFKLLFCLYRPEKGTICLLSKNEEEIPLDASWRNMFAYVPQGNLLTSGTIREAVTFGCMEDMSKTSEIREALEKACAWEFVSRLPDGMDTIIMENGLGLSEGQLQRISIARAIFSRKPILLLDEATSALDEATEKEVLLSLKALSDRTVLVVTHRQTVFPICDWEIHIANSHATETQLR